MVDDLQKYSYQLDKITKSFNRIIYLKKYLDNHLNIRRCLNSLNISRTYIKQNSKFEYFSFSIQL